MIRSILTFSAFALFFGLTLLKQTECQADLVIAAEFTTGELLGDRTVAPGETVALDLFASETADSTQLADLGLTSARLLISPGDFQFAGSTADDAFVSLPELDNPNPGNDNTIEPTGDLLILSQGLSNPDFPNGFFDGLFFPVFPTDGRVRLGTLNLVVPNDADGTVSFQLEDGVDETFFSSGSVVFGGFLLAGDVEVLPFTGTLQVASVPEPSATVLLMSFALGSLSCRRRRLNG